MMENGYIINDLSPTHEGGYMFNDLSPADDSEVDVKPIVHVIEPVSGPQETDPQENSEPKALVKLEEIDEEQWSNICSNLDDPTLSSVRVKTEKNTAMKILILTLVPLDQWYTKLTPFLLKV